MTQSMLLSNFVEINPNVSLKKGQEYPFVGMEDVEPGRRYVSAVSTKPYTGGGSKFEAGDILFARITPCLENGKIAQFSEVNGECGFGSTEFFVFRAREGVSDPTYVFYLSYTDIIRKPAEKSMSGASGRQRASLASLENLEVPAPSLPTQRKIAAILSVYDDLIENNTRRIKILEEMAQMIYREWFVNFRFPGHEKINMIESGLGMIPEGWEVKRLGDLCQVIPGYAFKSSDWQESGVPVIRIKNIQADNTIDTSDIAFVSDDVFLRTPTKFCLQNADFLIAMTGATAGKVGRLRTKIRMLLNQRVARIVPTEGFNSFVWCAISTEESKERFFGLADGAAQPNMSGSQIEAVKLIVPTDSLTERFSGIADSILTRADDLYLKNANLHCTRDLLLPKLISGEIDVEDLDIAT